MITGGAGYIGNHLTKFLLEEDYQVVVIDKLLFGDAVVSAFSEHPNFEFVEGDVRNIGDMAKVIKDAHAIIHLAAVVGDPASSKNPDYTRTVNIESTRSIVSLANFYQVDRLLFASSCSVYGAAPADILLNEGSYLNPVSLYAETRIVSEEIIFSECHGPTPTALRLATAYGYSKRMRFDLAVNIMTLKALTKGKVLVLGGNQYRPFVHCEDVARAFHAALKAPKKYVTREAFNVGSNAQNYKIKHLGELIADALGAEVEVRKEKEDERNYRVDFAKIEWLLKFLPQREIAESVKEIKAAFDAGEFEDWNYDKYYNVRYDYML